MSRAAVVDASVAFKWFVEEEGSDAARALLLEPRRLVAPELLLAMDRDTSVTTADERFARVVGATSLAERVVLLGR